MRGDVIFLENTKKMNTPVKVSIVLAIITIVAVIGTALTGCVNVGSDLSNMALPVGLLGICMIIMTLVWNKTGLIVRIILGLVIGIVLALICPDELSFITMCGDLFVKALKAVAPILVLFIVMGAIAQHKAGQETNIKHIIILYLIATFMAALVAVIASFMFKVKLLLPDAPDDVPTPPGGLSEVIQNLLGNIVDNPINALLNMNFIGILAVAILFGLAFRVASDNTKKVLEDIANATNKVVTWVIKLAPFGVMGLVFNVVATTGIKKMVTEYGKIILLLVGTMIFIALIVNPIIVFVKTRKNPYPLVLKCLVKSGLYAFFTRSSAANIPVNMELCEELGLDEDTYSISIPLGATINMGGAAITISILTLAAAHTVGVEVGFGTALVLSVLSALSACGASGVAGGSLLLIPLACSLFGIPMDVAMQVVGIGYIIGVIQDSCETAINSSTDVLFTATAEIAKKKLKKQSKK